MFSDVENNAQQQDRLFQDTRSPLIEDYYPELHQENATPFSCSISSNLIPDLITRRRILIDLGELPTEADLINRFGVNKAFLMELRKRKLVHIATNLDPGRHERNVWMHDILADKETIFKSTRTPRFFRARFPDIESVQKEYQQYLSRRLESLSTQDYDFLISRMDVVPTNAPRAGAANKLAWDLARVQAMDGSWLEENPFSTPDKILSHPENAMDLLYRYKMLAVSPHSGALGGQMLVPYQLMKRLFPETPPNELLRNENVIHEEIMSYLATVNLNVEPAYLTGPAYWISLSPLEQRRMLDRLEEDVQDRASEKVEQDLRLRIASNDPDISCDEIREFVEKDVAVVKRYEEICSRGYTTVNGLFAAFVINELTSLEVPMALACLLGGDAWLSGEILRKDAKNLLESAVPRIRVANYVKSRSK